MSQPTIGLSRCHASSSKSGSVAPLPKGHLGALLDIHLVEDAIRFFDIRFRERVFTPYVTLWTWLSQILSDKPSCRKAVKQLMVHRLANGLPSISTLTGSFTKAKARLPVEFFEHIALAIAGKTESAGEKWWWKGSIDVKVVDGTVVAMLDTAANDAEFPKLRHQKAGVGFPHARVLGVFSLATGSLLRVAINATKGKGTGEQTLLRSLWDGFTRGQTLLGDCMFSSFVVVAEATLRGIDVVAEFRPTSGKLLRKQKLDQVVMLKKRSRKPAYMTDQEYSELPKQIKARIIKVRVSCRGFRPKTKYILTTHLASRVTADDIADLYRQRWRVELNYAALKTSLGMNFIRGRSPIMVRKEIWMHVLAYNLLRGTMAIAACLYECLPQQISFRATQHIFAAVRQLIGLVADGERMLGAMLQALPDHRIGHRPNRYEPRVLKRHTGRYRTMIVPRDQARRRQWKRAK